jgi:Zn-dependent oligopeptidase
MTPEDIIEQANKIINSSNDRNKRILGLAVTDENSKKLIELLSEDQAEYMTFHSVCNFLLYVSPNEAIKQACAMIDKTLSKHIESLNNRKDIYDKIVMFNDIRGDDFLKYIIDCGNKNGIRLDPSKKEVVQKVKREIVRLESYIDQQLARSEEQLVGLKLNELEGLPESFKKILPLVNGVDRYGGNISVCMKYLKSKAIRKKIEIYQSASVYKIIDKIMRLIILRDKYAKLIGYPNYSSYVNSNSIITNVRNMLTGLLTTFDFRYCKEVQTLAKFGKLHSYDLEYYTILWKRKYGLDECTISKYFPLNHVMRALIELYENMFGIKFVKITDKPTWHPSVSVYAVHDGKPVLGYVYFDMYARKNKLTQTRCFVLRPSSGLHRPVVALTSCFSGEKHQMTQGELLSLAHEFGNIMTQMYGHLNVQHDFIEIPAYVLENVCWDKSVLKKLSSPMLPDAIIDKMLKMRDLTIGITAKKQILCGLYDQIVHSSDSLIQICEEILKQNDHGKLIETIDVFNKQLSERVMCSVVDPNSCKIAMKNCMNLTDAKYYNKLWSRICAADIVNDKCKEGFGSKFGLEFKNMFLEKIGIKNGMEILKNYLGKKSTVTGFIELNKLEAEHSFFFNSDKVVKDTETENGFTEIDTDNTTYKDLRNKINNIINEKEDYKEENTESLKRYKDIFIK